MTDSKTQTTNHQFNLLELSGSLGDIGTLIPLAIALIVLCNLSFTTVFGLVGAYYIVSGLFFRLPMPVQPLKVVAAVAIASPSQVNDSILSATAIVFGIFLLFIAITGLIDRIARFFSLPIVRGIQLGLGLILIRKGLGFIMQSDPFAITGTMNNAFEGISFNFILGVAGSLVTLVLITNKRFPAALVIVSIGILIGIFYGKLANTALILGPSPVDLPWPTLDNFLTAITLLVIPQVPLTIGNAIIGTNETAISLFGDGEATRRASNTNLSISMGLANLVIGLFGGIPLCHGAGGLAAHYRFGARTGGSNLIIGGVFLAIAIFFGSIGIVLLGSLPVAILGILLLFAGLELATLIKDQTEKNDLFVVLLIASIGFISTNMSIAFIIGIAVTYLMRLANIKL